MRLSQAQLNLLSTCPRKFQNTYLEQLVSPVNSEQQEKLAAGSRFHLLLQQWQLGLPVDPFVAAEAELQGWFKSFMAAAPQILALSSEPGEPLKQSEYGITIEFQGYLLTVIYDLLIANQQQAKILDWKTYARPQNPRWLIQNWQTRLYLFVLAETGAYLPGQLSMAYWFFQSQGGSDAEPQSFAIAYDAAKHEQTRQDLTHLLSQLTHWLERYQAGEPFPQVPLAARQCEPCQFAVRCDRATFGDKNASDAAAEMLAIANPSIDFSLPNLSDIQEVPL